MLHQEQERGGRKIENLNQQKEKVMTWVDSIALMIGVFVYAIYSMLKFAKGNPAVGSAANSALVNLINRVFKM